MKVLKGLQPGIHPKGVIESLSESLLKHYLGRPLIDAYAVYQHLMDYWAKTMQDDCYLTATDGWKAETYRVIETDKKGKEKDKGWACDLVPKALIVERYFAQERGAIDALTTELESVTAQLAELEEEHCGDEGAFSELEKVNKNTVGARLKEVTGDKEAQDEAAVLSEWLRLNGQQSELRTRLKGAEAELDAHAYAKYPEINESEIKELVVDYKWLATLDADIHGEMNRVNQQLTGRAMDLAERYEAPLPHVINRVAELEAKMRRHLEKMGFIWE